MSVVYSDPTTVTVTWNQLSSEYKITEYRVNVMINGLLDTRTVTEPSITIMDVGVDDTLNITVAAVDIIDRGGTFSDTLELNYTKGESSILQIKAYYCCGGVLLVPCNFGVLIDFNASC